MLFLDQEVVSKRFADQQTGKNFNRPRYTIMKEDVLRAGDELIITEVDRLGRNKQETLKEFQYYRDNGIIVVGYFFVVKILSVLKTRD